MDIDLLTALIIEASKREPEEWPGFIGDFIKSMALETVLKGTQCEPDMGQVLLPYPDQFFDAIEIDYPWKYMDQGYNGFQDVQEYRIHCPYPVLGVKNLARLAPEQRRVCKENCHCYMWVTKDFLPPAYWLMSLLGFDFKNIITWVKLNQKWEPTYGMGHWFRNGTEFMLYGVKGRPGRPLKATSTPNYIHAPRGKHSQKPEEAYQFIRENVRGEILSMFSRTDRAGFHNWGNEVKIGPDNSEEGLSIVAEYLRLKESGKL